MRLCGQQVGLLLGPFGMASLLGPGGVDGKARKGKGKSAPDKVTKRQQTKPRRTGTGTGTGTGRVFSLSLFFSDEESGNFEYNHGPAGRKCYPPARVGALE